MNPALRKLLCYLFLLPFLAGWVLAVTYLPYKVYTSTTLTTQDFWLIRWLTLMLILPLLNAGFKYFK